MKGGGSTGRHGIIQPKQARHVPQLAWQAARTSTGRSMHAAVVMQRLCKWQQPAGWWFHSRMHEAHKSVEQPNCPHLQRLLDCGRLLAARHDRYLCRGMR